MEASASLGCSVCDAFLEQATEDILVLEQIAF